MRPADYDQLVQNIKRAGHLESVPFCALQGGVVETVSGHHRVRAAIDAGIKRAPILVDASGLTRSAMVAKQIAHNRLEGQDDPETLRLLFSLIETPDEMLESGVSGDILDAGDQTLEPLLVPHLDIDWKIVPFTFLPHQLDNLTAIIDAIPPSDAVMVADMSQFKPFLDAATKFSRLKNIRNASTAIAVISEELARQNGLLEAEEEAATRLDDGWVTLSDITGTTVIPSEAADVLRKAIDTIAAKGDIGARNRWQALEYMAADFLAGSDAG